MGGIGGAKCVGEERVERLLLTFTATLSVPNSF